MEKRCGDTVLNCNERWWPLQFIAVVANCNAKRVPRPRHCIAVQCNEAFATAAPLQSPWTPAGLRTRVGHCIRVWATAISAPYHVVQVALRDPS